jgi:hypothetical protein
MLSVILWAQLAATKPADSTYSSPALRTLIAGASVANRRAPDSLRSYTSRIETESSLLIRDTLGREHTAEVEQMATAAKWDRGGRYDLHIVGYRSQSVGVPYSTLSIVRAWTVPSLYGERLSLGAYFGRARTRTGSDTLIAVHPFALDRDQYYQFSGGDTVTTLRAGSRSIPIVRVRVRPNFHGPTRLSAFDGEIDLDGDRKQIVRMRGQFVTIGGQPSTGEKLARATLGLTAAAYVEFVNAEIGGKYWLPAFQRTEFQAGFAILGQTRPVFRLVSTIRDIAVNDTGQMTPDSAELRRVFVTWAPGDSVSRFGDWRTDIGTQSGSVHSDDFDDLAPDAWRPTGAPRLNLFPNSTSRIFRFNRVEGLYLGLAPTVDFRSLVPGLSVGAFGGWAFTEKTFRGGAVASYRQGARMYGVRAERALVATNDFAPPLNDDPGIGALLGSVDNYDYVDRWTSVASFTRFLGSIDNGLAMVQLGAGRDRPEQARLTKGLFGSMPFLPNRGVLAGNYLLGTATLELHPNVTGDFVTPGAGGRAYYEVGSGDLDWQRMELSASVRKYVGPISFALHGDAGMVTGAVIPPQQLFELGGSDVLPGYTYKQFAGDRALLARTYVSYRFNIWKKPIRVKTYYLPGVSPGIVASIQSGWTEISSPAARAAVQQLGLDANGAALSDATHRVRATAGAGITLFSDLVHFGLARPIDQHGPWKLSAGFGATF